MVLACVEREKAFSSHDSDNGSLESVKSRRSGRRASSASSGAGSRRALRASGSRNSGSRGTPNAGSRHNSRRPSRDAWNEGGEEEDDIGDTMGARPEPHAIANQHVARVAPARGGGVKADVC
eukprot:7240660-Prymnesium_polylepis.2